MQSSENCCSQEHAVTEENNESFVNSGYIYFGATLPNSCQQKSPAFASESPAGNFGIPKQGIVVDEVRSMHQNLMQHDFKISANTCRQIMDGISDNTGCPNTGNMSVVSKLEIETLKSLADVIDDLKISNSQLKHSTDVLSAKYTSLEKTYEELECKNRTIERELAMLHSESDQTKQKLLQVTSDVSKFVATNESKFSEIAATEVLEKESCETSESPNELEVTKINLQKLGNDMNGVTSLLKDVNGKVTWLELEFQKFLRRHSLVIENLCPKEDRSATEMFLVFVNCMLNVKIEDGDIESVHVITQPSSSGSPEKRPRPILVTFACYGTRSRVYKAWLGLRSSKLQVPGTLSGERGQGICIREYLTELQDSFYREAIHLREKHLISDCWTFKGKTYVRTLDGEVKEFNKEQWLPNNETATSGCSIM